MSMTLSIRYAQPASHYLRGLGGCLLAGMVLLVLAGAGPMAAVRPAPARQRMVARQALGQLLFFEPALSSNGKRSCASCHRPEKAFCDQRALPRALRFTQNLDRNSPTLLNASEQASFFHDGRARSLGAVLTAVLTSPREFGSSYAEATARLRSSPEYRRRFRQAFGAGTAIDSTTLAEALRAYLGTLNGQAAPYDLARRGGPPLDTAAQAGARLFAQAGSCGSCHAGPLFRDGQRHEVRPGLWLKTPGLRNLTLTMPYGAEGGYPTVEAVLSAPFHQAQRPNPLDSNQLRQISAFLQTLTDTAVAGRGRPAALPLLPALPDRVVGGLY